MFRTARLSSVMCRTGSTHHRPRDLVARATSTHLRLVGVQAPFMHVAGFMIWPSMLPETAHVHLDSVTKKQVSPLVIGRLSHLKSDGLDLHGSAIVAANPATGTAAAGHSGSVWAQGQEQLSCTRTRAVSLVALYATLLTLSALRYKC